MNELFKNRYIDNIKDNYFIKYNNVILTSYYTLKKDPQWDIYQDNNSYEYIKPWYSTMLKYKLHGIIFHDCLSDEFIKQYQTEEIIFKKCKIGDYSINDERFIIYLMYLKHNKYQNVFMTDVSDIQINNSNPFQIIENNNKLYAGTDEGNTVENNPWMMRRIHYLNDLKIDNKLINGFKKMYLYNAGIIGGCYDIICNILEKKYQMYLDFNNENNNNTLVFNFIIFNYFKNKDKTSPDYDVNKLCSKYIFSGYPLNSKYKLYEKDTKAYIIHK